MSEGNRVVVTDQDGAVERIKSDREIVEENEKLEQTLKEKTTKNEQLKAILEERKAMRKQQKEQNMTVMLAEEEQDRSLNIGIVGVGQCGSKIAQELYDRGYSTVAINTALQDLKHIKIPERQKLFLDYALGGAGKDLDTGREAAEQFSDEIFNHIADNTDECEVLMLCVGGGGGSGSGSATMMIDIMSQLGKPISVMYVLPMSTEDTLAKHNSICTLAELSKLAANDTINSLIVIDNAKIELILPGKSLSEFWSEANKCIVEPLHLFNMLSAQASEHISLDPTDFSRVFVGTGDCSLYGMIEIDDYLENEEAIAEAIVTNLEGNLLSSDFNLSETRSVGVIITGSKKVLAETPASHLEYGLAMLNKITNDGTRVFKGIYEMSDHPDTIRVYSWFSGLGLPSERILELKNEAEKHMKALQSKEDGRATNMNIDMGKTKAVSATDQMHRRIKNKNSAMGKLKRNSKNKSKVVDRRRR